MTTLNSLDFLKHSYNTIAKQSSSDRLVFYFGVVEHRRLQPPYIRQHKKAL